MKVRALKHLLGSYGLLNKGDIIDLPNYLANDLLALGYAEAADKKPVTEVKVRKTRGRRRDNS